MTMTNAATARKIAVVLFNLGGPDGPDDVQPFLYNLFNDPAIIGAPAFVRTPLAHFISRTRAKSAKENYAKMGGGSPLLPETQRQSDALIAALSAKDPSAEWRAFIAMRYWSPFVEDVAADVDRWAPDEVILLPLYPQFSTTTTGSSLGAWRDAGGRRDARVVCCYPTQDAFIAAHAEALRTAWRDAGSPSNTRVLYSAHGLPERIVQRGDPYQWQIERTVAAVAERLPELPDWTICYQSRVGPLKWIGPSTEEAIDAAAADAKGILLTPIAFVSEHIETLVELDEEYAERAHAAGVKTYLRAPALGVDAQFISGLAELALDALTGPPGFKPPGGGRICPLTCGSCPVTGQAVTGQAGTGQAGTGQASTGHESVEGAA